MEKILKYSSPKDLQQKAKALLDAYETGRKMQAADFRKNGIAYTSTKFEVNFNVHHLKEIARGKGMDPIVLLGKIVKDGNAYIVKVENRVGVMVKKPEENGGE